MSPGIRNPELNTAECVTQGHEPNISDPGVSHYVKPILWCSFVSVLLLGPIIALFLLDFLEIDHWKRPMIYSSNVLFSVFLISDVALIIVICRTQNPGLKIYIPVVCTCIILEGIVLYSIQYCCSKCKICDEPKKLFTHCFIFKPCINLLLYHLCWVIVGIILNPAWGLTVLFIVCFVVVALLFSLGQICDTDNNSSCIYRFLVFFSAFCGLGLVGALAVLAGQSFYGRETAEDVIKTGLFYVVGVIFWIFKKEGSNDNPNNNRSNSPTQSDQVTNRGTPGMELDETKKDMGATCGMAEERSLISCSSKG